MPRTSATKYALLGLLSCSPSSGYAMKKFIDESIRYFWTENYGNIYPALSALEREGLAVKQRAQTSGRPDSNVFTITAKGEKELDKWLAEPCLPQLVRSELLLKLFFAGRLSRGKAAALLKAELAKHKELLERYKKTGACISEHGRGDKAYWLLTLDYGRRHSAMVCKWCEHSLSILEKKS
jgi:DNA-binding PadR family transcriptional regulator